MKYITVVFCFSLLISSCAVPHSNVVYVLPSDNISRIAHCDDGKYIVYDACAFQNDAYTNMQVICRGRIYSINNVLQDEELSDIYWFYVIK